MLAEEPFLHESLMLEREEGLSEEEKKEAELWFAKEQYKEEISPFNEALDFSDHYGGHSRAPRGMHANWMPPPYYHSISELPPMRSTPVPHMLDLAPMYGSSGCPTGYVSNGGYAGRNPMEAPRRVPPFPGAAIAFEPSGNSRGSVQLIRTDRAMTLPIVSHPSEKREIPPNTQAMLVRSADGVFLRLSNGLLLNARDTVFDAASSQAPPLITIPPDPPQPLRLPPRLKTSAVPDVIELD